MPTEKEHSARCGIVARFLGTSVYNGEDMLRAREIQNEDENFNDIIEHQTC